MDFKVIGGILGIGRQQPPRCLTQCHLVDSKDRFQRIEDFDNLKELRLLTI